MPPKYHFLSFFVPDFIEAQRASFLQLLKEGIPTEIAKYNPIEIPGVKYLLSQKSKKSKPINKDKINRKTIYYRNKIPSLGPIPFDIRLPFKPDYKKIYYSKTLSVTDLSKKQIPSSELENRNNVTAIYIDLGENTIINDFFRLKQKQHKTSCLRNSETRLTTVAKFVNRNQIFQKQKTNRSNQTVGFTKTALLNQEKTKQGKGKTRILVKTTLFSFCWINRFLTGEIKIAKSLRQKTNAIFRPHSEFIQTDNIFQNQTVLADKRPHRTFQKNLAFPKKKFTQPNIQVFLHGNKYKLIAPNTTIQSAIFKSQTHACKIYVPAEIRRNNQVLLAQWLLLGNLPLMTNRGHFIINGTPRVVLHQLVRSPGIYFHAAKKKKTFYADIICHRGFWLRLENDKKNKLWVRMKNTSKIPLLNLLQVLGLQNPYLLTQLESHPSLQLSHKPYFSNPPQKLRNFYKTGKLRKDKRKVEDIAENMVSSWYEAQLSFCANIYDIEWVIGAQKFTDVPLNFLKQKLSSKIYDLSHLGRLQLNKKLGLSLPIEQLTLTLDDWICITNYFVLVQNGKLPIDDIDHLKNRRVRCSGELIQNQLGTGLIRLKRMGSREERFGIRKSDRLKLTRKTKKIKRLVNTKCINGAFKEFFNLSPLSQFLDQTNSLAEITHKRRLSSLGPGGITRETAGMKIRSIHPSHYGRICPIETPEGPNAGLVNSLTTYARINPNGFLETPFYKVQNGLVQNQTQLFYLSAAQDENYSLAPPDLDLGGLGLLKDKQIPIRLGSEFTKCLPNDVDFIGISRIQMISVATSLIPFLEHDDANRALMGSNMQRQSVPILKPERAIVGTGLEGRVVSDSGHSIQARESGIVTYVSSKKIQVLSFFYKYNHFEAGILTYTLQSFNRSNQNTCLTQRPLVKEGQWVAKGTCLVDCASSAFGELAIGKNVLVAYLPWEGYNFEDAILVSERLIYDDLFTSVHIVRHKTEIRETKFGVERITKESFENTNQGNFHNLDANGIIQLGTWVSEGDILVRKVTPIGKRQFTAFQKFLYVIVDKEMPTVKDTSLRVPKGLEGRVIDIKVRKATSRFVEKPSGPECVYIWIAEKKWLQVGDKMAGRHGNKGIVSRILPRQDMPYLPDGTPIDIVLNPLGVPSRMNVGQIYESLLGLAGKHLNQNFKIIPFDEISGPEASRSITFAKLYEARKYTGKRWLFEPAHPGKVPVFDGRTGQSFDQAITVGQAYMLKLIHLVDEKIHARATGPYSLVTQQPLRGRSKHGGQRFGEMEVWALEGFGAAYALQEILTIKSDDIYGRQQVMNTLFKGKPITVGRPESFRVLVRELQSLCLKVNIFEYPRRTKSGQKSLPINLDGPEFNRYE